jgi:hypothetical protein
MRPRRAVRGVRCRQRGAISLPAWLIVAAVVIVVAIAVAVTWRTTRSSEPSGTVKVDIAKLRESVQQNGMGHGGRH